jgi:hypothetical protein
MNTRRAVKSMSLALALTIGGVYAAAQNPTAQTEGDRVRGDERETHGGLEGKVHFQGEKAEDAIQDWKPQTKELAKQLISKYGDPQEVTAQRLIWHNNGPWQQTELVNEEILHNFPTQHMDVLKQTVFLKVPNDKLVALAEYDGSVIVDQTSGRISARCGKEEMNFLALNLAHDIISGKKSAAEARAFYAKTVTAFMDGQKDPYTQKLQFQPTRVGEAISPDKPAKAAEKKPIASLDNQN